ncbi:DNA cytosine methyltransferase [Amycolatopsis sp. cmx-11-32]|uniref:DNA cytosine methyltransferase n=1 Tax=Amycolatopsis sp. cmx-11-32 TaxID=2785796 RepID=UPI0039E639A0
MSRHPAGRRAGSSTARPRDRREHRILDRELVIGSLCTGYGGLDLGVIAAFGRARTAWVADPDRHVSAILAARMPGVRNLGDITTTDWTEVEPVDVIVVGFPCQDISSAGRGAGIRKGTRSGLWHQVVAAVRHLRPALLVVENVAALRWRKGGLDVVLGDLAEIGYDACWTSVRASDIGAPHRRDRVFLVAYPAGSTFTTGVADPDRRGRPFISEQDGHANDEAGAAGQHDADRCRPAATDSTSERRQPGRLLTGIPQGRRASGDLARCGDDVPADSDEQQSQRRRGPCRLVAAAGPTPEQEDQRQRHGHAAVNRGEAAADHTSRPYRSRSEGGAPVPDSTHAGRNEGQPQPAPIERRFDLVAGGRTPLADTTCGWQPQQPDRGGGVQIWPRAGTGCRDRSGDPADRTRDLERSAVSVAPQVDWGIYGPAIRRWEATCGLAAPHPTEPGKSGRARLSPAFVEWMMGLDAGWVTDLDIPRTAQLRALGNGVVPQQAAYALRLILADLVAIHAADDFQEASSRAA